MGKSIAAKRREAAAVRPVVTKLGWTLWQQPDGSRFVTESVPQARSPRPPAAPRPWNLMLCINHSPIRGPEGCGWRHDEPEAFAAHQRATGHRGWTVTAEAHA